MPQKIEIRKLYMLELSGGWVGLTEFGFFKINRDCADWTILIDYATKFDNPESLQKTIQNNGYWTISSTALSALVCECHQHNKQEGQQILTANDLKKEMDERLTIVFRAIGFAWLFIIGLALRGCVEVVK